MNSGVVDEDVDPRMSTRDLRDCRLHAVLACDVELLEIDPAFLAARAPRSESRAVRIAVKAAGGQLAADFKADAAVSAGDDCCTSDRKAPFLGWSTTPAGDHPR